MILPSIVRHLVVSLHDREIESRGQAIQSGDYAAKVPKSICYSNDQVYFDKLTAPDQISGDSSCVSGASAMVPAFGETMRACYITPTAMWDLTPTLMRT